MQKKSRIRKRKPTNPERLSGVIRAHLNEHETINLLGNDEGFVHMAQYLKFLFSSGEVKDRRRKAWMSYHQLQDTLPSALVVCNSNGINPVYWGGATKRIQWITVNEELGKELDWNRRTNNVNAVQKSGDDGMRDLHPDKFKQYLEATGRDSQIKLSDSAD